MGGFVDIVLVADSTAKSLPFVHVARTFEVTLLQGNLTWPERSICETSVHVPSESRRVNWT